MVKGTAEKINVVLSGQQCIRSPVAAAPQLRLSRLGRPSLPWPSASSSAAGEGTKSLVCSAAHRLPLTKSRAGRAGPAARWRPRRAGCGWPCCAPHSSAR